MVDRATPASKGERKVVKHRWTPREDQMLLDAISVRGPHNWSAIALQLPERNEKQCRERWVNQLRPDMRKGGWTLAEDATIVEMFSQVGSSWSEIAKCVPGRTDQAIKNRYNNYLKPRDGRRPVPTTAQLYPSGAPVARAGGSETGGLSSDAPRPSYALPAEGSTAGVLTVARPISAPAAASFAFGAQLLGGGSALGGVDRAASGRRADPARSVPMAASATGGRLGGRLLSTVGGLRNDQSELALSHDCVEEMVYTSTLLTLVAASDETPERDSVINRLIGSLASIVHKSDSSTDEL